MTADRERTPTVVPVRRNSLTLASAIAAAVACLVGGPCRSDGNVAEAAARAVTVSPRVASASTARVASGGTIHVDVVASTTAGVEVDAARVVLAWDPTYLRSDGWTRPPAFDLLPGLREGEPPGRARFDVARSTSPWPSGATTLGTVRFVGMADGEASISVVTTGTSRTRVAGERQELVVTGGVLRVVVGPDAVPATAVPVVAAAPPPSPSTRAPSTVYVPASPSGAAPTATAFAPDAAPIASDLVADRGSSWLLQAVAGPTRHSLSTYLGSASLPAGFEPGERPVDGAFAAFYDVQSGMRLLGRPMGGSVQRTGLTVQYFEKGRLEYHPGAPDGWQFQLGLLVDSLAAIRAPVPIGGDTSSLTYADVAFLSDPERRVAPPEDFLGGVATLPDGSTFVPFDAMLAPGPGHVVPEAFWQFLGDPTTFPGGWLHDAGLPVMPVAEATVTKGAVSRRILVQAFQRTVLTYDPLNPPGYVVECANTGTDYLRATGAP